MKMLVTVILSAVVIISSVIGYVYYLNHVTDIFMDFINSITASVNENNWDQAKETAGQLLHKWKKEKNILSAFTDHGDLDEIERGICELHKSVMYQNKETTARFASVLQILIERLKENEYPSWENVLKTAQFRHNMHNML